MPLKLKKKLCFAEQRLLSAQASGSYSQTKNTFWQRTWFSLEEQRNQSHTEPCPPLQPRPNVLTWCFNCIQPGFSLSEKDPRWKDRVEGIFLLLLWCCEKKKGWKAHRERWKREAWEGKGRGGELWRRKSFPPSPSWFAAGSTLLACCT